MPQHTKFHEPDQIDCNTCVTALAQDFGVLASIETRYECDQVIVLVRCRKIGGETGDLVQVQSMVRTALKTARSAYTMQYSALLDCWHQLDRGTLATATTPVTRGWDGRPRQPARTK